MILIENRDFLRVRHRPLLNQLSERESNLEKGSTTVEPSKNGIPTLKITIDGKSIYIHSKYDPESEATRLINSLKNVETYDHILFVGTGLGYHIKQMLHEYPSMKFSIYEPNEEVLVRFLAHQRLDEPPLSNLQTIFTNTEEAALRRQVEQIVKTFSNNVLIVSLPVYDRLYRNEIKLLMESLKNTLKERRSTLVTNVSFQQRWTINAIKNFPHLLRTPNILHDVDKRFFEGKPAIIVAAGPSLSVEFDNLRYIKEHGLAYIFSVGSAINALIEHGIYPDVACTYDPKEHNYRVIQILKDRDIRNVPLVFGSSVGYETLENYPGPMLHMIISQDTVAPYFVKHNDGHKVDMVLDAPSIAVVTFQLLSKLGVGKIILVGQNLAFLDNVQYAEGARYWHSTNKLSQEELKNSLTIKDVHGNDIRTNDIFNRMRLQLEKHIAEYSHIQVINTTKNGAHIEGTTFMELDRVMEAYLIQRVVVPNWYEAENSYDRTYVDQQRRTMDVEYKKLEKILSRLASKLNKIDQLTQGHQYDLLRQEFPRWDKEFKQLKQNTFYQTFLKPMVRVQFNRLTEANQSIRFEKDLFIKGKMVVEQFGKFLNDCNYHMQVVSFFYKDLRKHIMNQYNNSFLN